MSGQRGQHLWWRYHATPVHPERPAVDGYVHVAGEGILRVAPVGMPWSIRLFWELVAAGDR